MMYLNCHTYYSFKYGALSIDDLLTEAENNGVQSLVLTDINNTSACLDFIKKAPKRGIKPIVGIDFRNGVQQQFIGIAMNNQGFEELNRYLSHMLHHGLTVPSVAPSFEHSYVIYPMAKYDFRRPLEYHEYVGVTLKQLQRMNAMGTVYDISKMVLLHPVTFRDKKDFNAHRLLRAIDNNTLLSKLSEGEQAKAHHVMYPIGQIQHAYRDYPQIIRNTEQLLDRCEIGFELGVNRNKAVFADSKREDVQLLRSKAEEGLAKRYPKMSDAVRNRLETELKVITDLDFCAYFLINWDIVNYAKGRGYPQVGRGSGANSIVAYLLGITDVDPIELDLYFERFINPYRTTPPDFDIDFNWTDRDDVTRYIFEKHGKQNVALLGAYNTFQKKSVIREIGKVFGLPSFEIDKLQQTKHSHQIDELGKLTLQYSNLIAEFPSHLSIHSSGILISNDPIHRYSATSLPPKGYPTCQFSMLEAEDIGLHKFDILSQRGLGKIRDAVTIIKENKDVDIDIHDFDAFKKDEKIKDMLREGEAIGCFYVESPAMRMLLKKLKADDYIRLVAASSIIRPGVAKSGMMREYILRYQDEKRREEARKQLPELYDLLEETYGVMVYQEDVIKVAHYFGGLTLTEADHLRRGMSWKFRQRSDFWKAKDAFFENCMAKGHSRPLVQSIWDQIESFANYAFAKGHSASYAVESYQALYLKAHFPLEYMVATLNNFGGFYHPEVYIHEARKFRAEVVAPCVNHSDGLTRIEANTIYLGLDFVQGLEKKYIFMIVEDRKENGEFTSLNEFADRIPLPLEQLVLLIRVNALRFTGVQKKELLWQAHMLLSGHDHKPTEPQLFPTRRNNKSYVLPRLVHTPLEDAHDEIELMGFTLHSPYSMLKDPVPSHLTVKDMIGYEGAVVDIVGYLVTIKNTRTGSGQNMAFGTFLDLDGNWLDTVHFPPSLAQYPFQGRGCYLMRGTIALEFGYYTLEVSKMERLASKVEEY